MSVYLDKSKGMKFYNLDEIDITLTLNPITLLEQLALVFGKSEIILTTNACEFIDYEHKFDLNNSYLPIEEEITSMIDERDDAHDNKVIEEVDNVQIGAVVVDRAWFEDDESALVTSKLFLEQRPTDVTSRFHSIRTLWKERGSWCAQESPQTALDLFFHYSYMYDDIHILFIFILYLSSVIAFNSKVTSILFK